MRKIIVDKQIAINWVHQFIAKHNRLPGLNDWEIQLGAPYNKTALYKELGGPNGVLEAAGYYPRKMGQISDLEESLLQNLYNLIILHRTTDRDILRAKGLRDRSVYKNRFGSWAKAITLCGIDNRHRIILKYFDDYVGENPIVFLQNKLGQDGDFTPIQKKYIEQAQALDGDPNLVRQHINYKIIKQLFGYVSLLLIAAGYTPNVDWKTGVKYIADDGHECDSQEEVDIDNYLTKIGFEHQIQIPYPKGKMTCDFVVGDVFIEYAGLLNTGHKSYEETIAKKQKMAKEHNIHLIVLTDTSQKTKLKLRAALESNLY